MRSLLPLKVFPRKRKDVKEADQDNKESEAWPFVEDEPCGSFVVVSVDGTIADAITGSS